jgi:prepilin-type N-terminal cleavage/methylation domain-containing protein
MGKRKLSDNYGYTLMELITAAAIVLTISSAAAVNYTRYIASTQEKVCIINRQTIIYEYNLYCLDEPEIALSDYIKTYDSDDMDSLCPCEGSYTAGGSGLNAEISCSVHREVTAGADATN